jgi:hypothetical protein
MLRHFVKDCRGELHVVRDETQFLAHSVKSVNPVKDPSDTLYRGDLEWTPHLKVKVRVTRGLAQLAMTPCGAAGVQRALVRSGLTMP